MSRLRPYMFGGGASGALIAGAVAAFASITALVSQSALPGGEQVIGLPGPGTLSIATGAPAPAAKPSNAPLAPAALPAQLAVVVPTSSLTAPVALAPSEPAAQGRNGPQAQRHPGPQGHGADRPNRHGRGSGNGSDVAKRAASAHGLALGHSGSPGQAGTAPGLGGNPSSATPAQGSTSAPAAGSPPGLAKKPGGLPPGLAKKSGGSPPGLAKKHRH